MAILKKISLQVEILLWDPSEHKLLQLLFQYFRFWERNELNDDRQHMITNGGNHHGKTHNRDIIISF